MWDFEKVSNDILGERKKRKIGKEIRKRGGKEERKEGRKEK